MKIMFLTAHLPPKFLHSFLKISYRKFYVFAFRVEKRGCQFRFNSQAES